MASNLMDGITRPVKVLMLSHYFAQRRGGIEAVAAALAEQLAARGFDVAWFASGDASAGNEATRCESLASASTAERMLALPYPLLGPSAWLKIYRETAQHDVVLVHDAVYMTSIFGYLAARARRKPLVIVQHVAFVPFKNRMLRALMHIANRCIAIPVLRGADQVIFISEVTQKYFSRVRWRRAPTLVFNGVDTDIFSPVGDTAQREEERRGLGLPPRGQVVLFVGRFVEKKGLNALEHLARQRPDLLFAFAGHGPMDPTRWSLPNIQVFTGLTGTRLASLYRSSDVLVLPSAGEGFPLVVQEALACGLPIICGGDSVSADASAAPFLQGIPVDLRNPEATAVLLEVELTTLLARGSTASDQRARAEFAKARYSWSRSGARYADILTRLCATSRPLKEAEV
jgi:glycosyltransferase involved in cell wall biosynthesis